MKKTIKLILIVGGLVLFFLVSALYSMKGSSQIVNGIVQDALDEYKPVKNMGMARRYLLVKLENGSTVKVRAFENTPVRKESKVAVLETTTALFGLKRFEFKEYLE